MILGRDSLVQKAFISDGLEKRQEDMKITAIVLVKNFIIKFLILTFNQLDTNSSGIISQITPLDSTMKLREIFFFLYQ